MTSGRETEFWRTKDGRMWRIGLEGEVVWIRENTEPGARDHVSDPAGVEAYATLELPGHRRP
jgi:hypothetical protein